MKGILGKKLGMTQVFDPETGNVDAVTVIQAGPCPVVLVRTQEADGYDGVQLAFGEVAERKLSKGEVGHLKKAGAKLLEPIMKVEVVTPEDYTGGIIGDLTSRRGHVQGQDTRGNANAITAMVPLANMFGYINTLRSMSSGRANFTMQFDHYDAVPQNISDEIQAKFA